MRPPTQHAAAPEEGRPIRNGPPDEDASFEAPVGLRGDRRSESEGSLRSVPEQIDAGASRSRGERRSGTSGSGRSGGEGGALGETLKLGEPSPEAPERRAIGARKGTLARGLRVRVVGLERAGWLNGQVGEVICYHAESNSYEVRLTGADGEPSETTLSRKNLEAVQDHLVIGDQMLSSGGASGSACLPSDLPPNSEHQMDLMDSRATSKQSDYHLTAQLGGDVGKQLPLYLRALQRYGQVVERRPWVMMGVYLVVVIIVLGAGYKTPHLNEDFGVFARADGEAMRNRDAFLEAINHQEELSRRRLQASPGLAIYYSAHIEFFYSAKSRNALSERVMREVRDFEAELRSLEKWHHLCHNRVMESIRWLCDPGESLVALAWPSRSAADDGLYRLEFDGYGSDPLPQTALLTHVWSAFNSQHDESRNTIRFFPRGFTLPAGGIGDPNEIPSTPVLRTRYSFHIVYGYAGDSRSELRDNLAQTKEDWTDFISNSVFPVLEAAKDKYEHTDIYYTGSGIASLEITSALMMDIRLAIGSIIFVTAYMWLHIRSLTVAIGCFFIIFCSVPLAYVLTPTDQVTIASFLSLFLVTVIDIDVVFVFNDFWDQSAHIETIDKRLAWTIVKAGKSCLATSLTTSLGFFANLASALQPLREFGMFMGMSVMALYFLALMFLPPLIIVRERQRARVKPQVVDISAGQAGTLAVVPVGGPKPAQAKEKLGPASRMSTRIQRLFSFAVDWIWSSRHVIWIAAAVCMPVFMAGVISGAELDQGVPDIFPAEHNQVAGAEVAGTFSTPMRLDSSPRPASGGYICPVTGSPVPSRSCTLHWCDMMPAANLATDTSSSSGTCWRRQTQRNGSRVEAADDGGFGVQNCSVVLADLRYSATGFIPYSAWNPIESDVLHQLARPQSGMPSPPSVSHITPLVLEDWERGEVWSSQFYKANALQLDGPFNITDGVTDLGSDVCEISTVCFLGVSQRCNLPGWRSLGEYSLSETPLPLQSRNRRLGELGDADAGEARLTRPVLSSSYPRRLQFVPVGKRIDVEVMFGLQATRSTPLIGESDWIWRFDERFEPDNPWAQRAMYMMCDDLPEGLYNVGGTERCWIKDFQSWLTHRHQRFPSRDFHNDVIDWYGQAHQRAKDQLWMKNRQIKACKHTFFVAVSKDISASVAMEYKGRWDDYVEMRNAAASETANRAWHTAANWVTAEAQVAIVESTRNTIIIECACAWLGILIFTGDPVLAALVLCLVLVNISGLAFFMITVMGWSIGPIEIIFLVVFLGFSVTYGLHMAHNYSEVLVDTRLIKGEREVYHRRRCLRWRSVKASNPEEAPSSYAAAHALDAEEPQPQDGRNGESLVMHKEPSLGKKALEAIKSDLQGEGVVHARFPRLEGDAPTPGEVRRARTRIAVLHVGGAILSATVSTIGSSIFLVLCTLRIFVKLGAVVMCVTTLSILFTLAALPAVLMVFGPAPDPCYKRLPRLACWALLARLRRLLGPRKRDDECSQMEQPLCVDNPAAAGGEDATRGEVLE